LGCETPLASVFERDYAGTLLYYGQMPTASTEFLTDAIINGLVAVGTIAIAVLAIWGEPIRRRWIGTKLNLKLLDPDGEFTNLSNGAPAWYYHVAVENLRPHAPANNAHVVLTKLTKPSADGQFDPETNPIITGPIPLIRQHAHTLPRLATVGPPAHFDLLNLVQRSDAQLQLVFVPNNLNPSIKAGERVLVELVAVSDQAQSPPLQVEISWNGQWSTDRSIMKRNLVVRTL
jgi:hypothetical protein